MNRARLLFAICLFLCFVVGSASATPCSSTQYDMMSWFTMGSSWSTQYHLTGNANPLYTYRGNIFYWMKGSSGHPWDINYFDNNYIYQWATEIQDLWDDPRSYKAFGGPGMPWSPRCVNMPPPGVYGRKLATITRASSPYTIYTNCAASSNSNLGHVVNEIWGPTPMSLGGSLAPNALTLTLSYRYSCDSSYDNCTYKETFDFQRPYGLVQWFYYKLLNGQYVQQGHTIYNQRVSGGAPSPDAPCW